MKDKLELRMKQNVAGEFHALIIDVCHDERNKERIYQVMDDAMEPRWTPSGMMVVTVENDHEALAGLLWDLQTWGDPFGGFSADLSFRFRPFTRMAWQTYSHMLTKEMFCECGKPRIKKDSYDAGKHIHWMTFCDRCHSPAK